MIVFSSYSPRADKWRGLTSIQLRGGGMSQKRRGLWPLTHLAACSLEPMKPARFVLPRINSLLCSVGQVWGVASCATFVVGCMRATAAADESLYRHGFDVSYARRASKSIRSSFALAEACPRERAIATIMASNWLMGLPAVVREAAISAYMSAASLSKPALDRRSLHQKFPRGIPQSAPALAVG